MGTFQQLIGVANMAGGPFEEVQAVVDTGATYTWLPRVTLEAFGLAVDPINKRLIPVPGLLKWFGSVP